jgi:hypothetical protein
MVMRWPDNAHPQAYASQAVEVSKHLSDGPLVS